MPYFEWQISVLNCFLYYDILPVTKCLNLWFGTAPAAMAGIIAVSSINGDELQLLVVVPCLLSGLHTMVQGSRALWCSVPLATAVVAKENDEKQLRYKALLKETIEDTAAGVTVEIEKECWCMPAWAAAGVVIGFASPLTGTGGPLIAMPLFLLWSPGGISMLQMVALAVVGTLPLTVVSTVWASIEREVDLGISLAVAASMCLGVPLGKKLASMMPVDLLKLMVSVALLGIAANILRQVL